MLYLAKSTYFTGENKWQYRKLLNMKVIMTFLYISILRRILIHYHSLFVHESQEAVFFSDGQALDSFKAGRYTLETKNIPLISKLRNLVTGGVSPFHTEVYFINLATMMDIPWEHQARLQ